MPVGTDSLLAQVTVNSAPEAVDTDLVLNVLARKERVFYRSDTGPDNVNIAYLIHRELTPESNVLVVNRARELVDNHPFTVGHITEATGRILSSTTDRFLLTDIFLAATATTTRTALFFSHTLSAWTADHTVIQLDIVDDSFEVLDDVSFSTDLSNGLVYSNLENSYTSSTGAFKLYYMKYALRHNTTGAITHHLELLNNRPVFREATYEDLDAGGDLTTTAKVYTLEEMGGTRWEVTTPIVDTYAIKRDVSALISVDRPHDNSTSEPWFLTVLNGRFFTSLVGPGGTSTTYKFGVNEFNNQVFSPRPPFKFRHDLALRRVNHHTLKTDRGGLRRQLGVDETVHIEVIVRDEDGIAKRAYSTDTTKIGTLFETGVNYTAGIRSVDERGGFIDVTETVLDTDQVEALYYFEEDRYELNTLDLNPLLNQVVLSRRYVLYLVPDVGGRPETLYYLTVDEEGRVIATSQPAGAMGDTVLLARIASSELFYDRQVGNPATVGIDQLSFLNRFTAQTILPAGHANREANPNYFVVAEVMVKEASAPDEGARLDIRVPGGGIIDDSVLLEEALSLQPEVQWYRDIGPNDGTPYPETASMLVGLPCDLLRRYGGRFLPDQLREIVQRHIALGTYPAIRLRAEGPTIIDFTPGVGSIVLRWSGELADRYNVRIATERGGPYSRHNSSAIADVPAGNVYTIGSLAANTTYWFYVAEVLTDGVTECLPGAIGHTVDFVPNPPRIGIKTLPA